MSYRRLIKGLPRQKQTLGMYKGITSIKSTIPVYKYELYIHSAKKKRVVISSKNREDVLVRLLKYAESHRRCYKNGGVHFSQYGIWVKWPDGVKEFLIDSTFHIEFINLLLDKKPKVYA